MSIQIYVGNIPYDTTKERIADFFSAFRIDSVRVAFDKATGRAKGYAFIELADSEDPDAVIKKMNGLDFYGRKILVNEAHRQEKPPARSGRRDDRRGSRDR